MTGGAASSGGPAGEIAITDLLRDLGLDSEEARRQGRQALEAAGLTNPRKRNISLAKREAAIAALRAALVLTCGSPGCREAVRRDRRQHVRAAAQACEVCGGSTSSRELQSMFAALERAGRRSLLVVGGTPNTQQAIADAARSSTVDVRLVEGTRIPKPAQARAWVDAADLVVLWGSTPLDHKVSGHFKRPEASAKTITVARRGAEALAIEVQRHLDGGRAGG